MEMQQAYFALILKVFNHEFINHIILQNHLEEKKFI